MEQRLESDWPGKRREAIDALTSPLLTKYTRIGIVVGIIENGRTAVFGYGKIGEVSSLTPDGTTLFEIGSITKVFTSLLLATMVEEGLVSLDTPLSALLPAFPNLPREMTLLRLATHTSGFPGNPSNLHVDWHNPYAEYSPVHLLAYLSQYKEKSSTAGSHPYLYSNLGFGVLGYALSQKLGLSYEQAILSRICEPLEMFDTCFTLTEEQRHQLATPYTIKGEPAANWDFLVLAGAGALRSNAHDMLRFLSANLGRFSTPLYPALDLCQQIQVEKLIPQSPLLGIGLGWHISLFQERESFMHWHNGGTGGYRSFMGFTRDYACGVVILTNYGLGINPEIDTIGSEVLRVLASGSSATQE